MVINSHYYKCCAYVSSFLQQVQVAALEVQNVKRAINRYGTLPKGARIGAYLESLRQNGIGEEDLESAAGAVTTPSACLSVAKLSCAQPGNMMRSNSSGGFQPSAASVSAAAAAARNRAAQPCIADFEFPPPPPPEELECEDVTNLRPSTEEASFRFGVNLRHREPSTDSCNSAKSEPAKKLGARPRDHPPSPPNHHMAGAVPSATSVSLPPSPPDPARDASFVGGGADVDNKHCEDGAAAAANNGEKVQLNHNLYKSVIPGIMKEMMDLKLVSDNKSGADDGCGDASSNVDFKQSLRKTSTDKGDSGGGSMFRVQLKKVDAKKPAEDTPLDMKSRLKKVDNGKVAAKDREGKTNGESTGSAVADEEDKRCSTGSINSLKKLWEGESPPEAGKEQQRKVWQPDEKPAIATKPTTKAAVANKQTASSAIYATPGGLANVLDVWPVLENNLNALKSSTNVSSASWLLLSDKVCSFHASCLSYVDSAAPPHTKFHLRELLTKLETQSRLLRSAGTRNQVENAKVLNELHSTLKDVMNAVQK